MLVGVDFEDGMAHFKGDSNARYKIRLKDLPGLANDIQAALKVENAEKEVWCRDCGLGLAIGQSGRCGPCHQELVRKDVEDARDID